MEALSDDLQTNYDRLIVEALQLGCVWGLRDEQGQWALVESEADASIDVMPFWSHIDLVTPLCSGEWSIYSPVAIELEEFLDDWLPGMHSDVLMVGVNWNAELAGREMEPLDLLEDFDTEMS